MIEVRKFEDTLIWQKSKLLTLNIYQLFHNSRDYGFKDQIQRAAISVMNNVAEGLERKGNKELARFLYIAKGSCGELRSMLHVVKDLTKITDIEFSQNYGLSIEISKMLGGFIRKITTA